MHFSSTATRSLISYHKIISPLTTDLHSVVILIIEPIYRAATSEPKCSCFKVFLPYSPLHIISRNCEGQNVKIPEVPHGSGNGIRYSTVSPSNSNNLMSAKVEDKSRRYYPRIKKQLNHSTPLVHLWSQRIIVAARWRRVSSAESIVFEKWHFGQLLSQLRRSKIEHQCYVYTGERPLI